MVRCILRALPTSLTVMNCMIISVIFWVLCFLPYPFIIWPACPMPLRHAFLMIPYCKHAKNNGIQWFFCRSGRGFKARADGETAYWRAKHVSLYQRGIDLVEVVPCPPDGELPVWCCPFYQWEGRYMIHRYIGREGDDCLMLGDGNVARIERVKRKDIIGVLQTICRPDGTTQDCRDARWLKKAEWWYRLRFLRRWLLPVLRYFTSGRYCLTKLFSISLLLLCL